MAILALVAKGESLPEPPYPVTTRAKGWRFEIDYERVKQSATWAVTPPEIRPWLLILWCEAWACTPCGSLENDDAVIAGRMAMPINLFRAHRDELMRGWRLHSDGRLYHAVVTEAVERVLQFRDKEARRVAAWRERRSSGNQPLAENVTRYEHVRTAFATAPEPEPVPEQEKNLNPKPKARLAPLPGWVSVETWAAYVEMRRRIKKPLTERAHHLVIAKLDRLRSAGHDPNAILDASTMNCWQDVYEPRAAGLARAAPRPPDLLTRATDDLRANLRAEFGE